jgi:hypothetical protein
VLNFIVNKYLSTNFTFMRRTEELHVTVLRIELHKVFLYIKTAAKNVLWRAGKGFNFLLQSPL